MKKTYIVPNLTVITINSRQHLLAGSSGDINDVGTNGSDITEGSMFGSRSYDFDEEY